MGEGRERVRRISGRRLSEEHRAMVWAGIAPKFRLGWLARRMDEFEADLAARPSSPLEDPE